jgi:hypothetical protein
LEQTICRDIGSKAHNSFYLNVAWSKLALSLLNHILTRWLVPLGLLSYAFNWSHMLDHSYCVQLQVETFAQFGVVFLLFALGHEFSLTNVLKQFIDIIFSIILLYPKYFRQIYISCGFLAVTVISISWKWLIPLLYLVLCFRLRCSCSCVASLRRYMHLSICRLLLTFLQRMLHCNKNPSHLKIFIFVIYLVVWC